MCYLYFTYIYIFCDRPLGWGPSDEFTLLVLISIVFFLLHYKTNSHDSQRFSIGMCLCVCELSSRLGSLQSPAV